jgi:hypothetical protein
MSIINNSHAIGVDSRDLVLKTRGTLHVKVGDRYYEIDFRNLGAKEDEEKEEYILSIDSKDQIESLEYPGENKLVIGLDGSIFITKNKTFVDVTPKAPVIDIENSTNNNEVIANQITSLETASVAGRLYNDNGYSFDFENGEIITESLTVNSEVKLPLDMVKNNCCRTHSETLDDGTTKVVKKYQNYDFVEIVEKPEAMSLKSGVLIKSSVDITLPVNIGEIYLNNCSFVSGGLYIIYVNDGKIIQTKLN